MVAAANNISPEKGIEHPGKKGCSTYFEKVNAIIALVVGLKIVYSFLNDYKSNFTLIISFVIFWRK